MRYVLPGVGATSEMYAGPWRALENTRFLDWPQNCNPESIDELARNLVFHHQIRDGDSVVGTSLGGMVACEIPKQIQLSQLVLIGSATRSEEISPMLRMLSPFIDLTPLGAMQFSAGKIASDLTHMFAISNPQFIRNMSKAIFLWEGLSSGTIPFRIHGTKDSIIPLPEDADVEIDGGGHLIAITHPIDCIRALLNRRE